MLGDPRNITEGVGLIGSAISSGAQYLYGRYVKFTSWFSEYKEQHPLFKRIWGVATHPITLTTLGLIGSIALAPVTSGFTLPFVIGLGASVALAVSSPIIQAVNKYRLEKAMQRNKLLQTIAKESDVKVALEQKPLSWGRTLKSFAAALPWDSIVVGASATAGVFVGFGVPSAVAIIGSIGAKVVSAGMQGKGRLFHTSMQQEISAQNKQLEASLKEKGITVEAKCSEMLKPVSFLKRLAKELNPFTRNYDEEFKGSRSLVREPSTFSKVEPEHFERNSIETQYEALKTGPQNFRPDPRGGSHKPPKDKSHSK